MQKTPQVYRETPLQINSKFILLIAMLFVTSSLAADVAAYYFVQSGSYILISGATIIFPLTYVLGDIVTEVYGYSTARKLIWLGLLCEIIFALLIQLVLMLPYAANLPSQGYYEKIFHHLFIFVLSSILGDIVSCFTNVYVMSKSKILLRGKHFITRSIISTMFGELILNIIICFMAFYQVSDFKSVLKITFSGYLLEMIYAILFSYPALILILILKKLENRDAYDIGVNYNLLKL